MSQPQEVKAIFTTFLSPKAMKGLEECWKDKNARLGTNFHTKQSVLEEAVNEYIVNRKSRLEEKYD